MPEILHELSKLYALRAGDLVFMGTPAGVGPLQPAIASRPALDDVVDAARPGRTATAAVYRSRSRACRRQEEQRWA